MSKNKYLVQDHQLINGGTGTWIQFQSSYPYLLGLLCTVMQVTCHRRAASTAHRAGANVAWLRCRPCWPSKCALEHAIPGLNDRPVQSTWHSEWPQETLRDWSFYYLNCINYGNESSVQRASPRT